jgi:ketol-acid reductoisomerase
MENVIFLDKHADLKVLANQKVAIIGYGIQGRPQALCMRDSGIDLVIGVSSPSRSSWAAAVEDGFEPKSIAEATAAADLVYILLADPPQPELYYESIHDHLKPKCTLAFCHGFNVLYGAIKPPTNVNVVLFVPNGPGHMVRQKFLDGSGIYGAISVEQDVTGNALEIVLALAKSVGSLRVGSVGVTFQQETEGDNFEEQVLYGGAIHLMKATFEAMVAGGYPPHFAYAKAIRSLRTVIDVMDSVGIEEYISRRSSRTCEFAVRTSGPRVVNYDEIQKIFDETERGEFAAKWMQEWSLGMPRLHRLRKKEADSQMEKTGREWREMFGEG